MRKRRGEMKRGEERKDEEKERRGFWLWKKLLPPWRNAYKLND